MLNLRHQKIAVRMLNRDGVWIQLPFAWNFRVRMRSLKSTAVQMFVDAQLQARRAALGGRFASGAQPLPEADMSEINRKAVIRACVDLGTDMDLGEDGGLIQPSTWGDDPEERAAKAREVMAKHFLGEGDSYDPALQQALQSAMSHLDTQEDREAMARAGKDYVFGASTGTDSED